MTAAPMERAEGAGALAHAFLYRDLTGPEREEVRLVLTGLLDDPSPLVRLALAENLAGAAHAPHYMVLTLAGDLPDIAAIVLARSPLLSDAELVDFAATTDAFGQSAIALRPSVSAPVAAALAETGAREALIALADNPGAELLEFSMRRMIERHGDDPALRAALLARPNLPAPVRLDIAGAAVKALAGCMTGTAWLPPAKALSLTRDAREKANVQIAAESANEANGALNFVAYLRASGQLTAGLLLRGLLCGNKHLFEAALCELSGMPMARVAEVVAASGSTRFTALYRKARMPERLRPVFAAGLQAAAKTRCGGPMNAQLRRPIVAAVIEACAPINDGAMDPLIARLRHLEAEAARDEARDFRRAAAPKTHARRGEAQSYLLPGATWPTAPKKAQSPAKAKNVTIDLAAFAAALEAA
ncbi:MAG: DUF2336 domain-containing protein, partial [Nitrosotalea sp.]